MEEEKKNLDVTKHQESKKEEAVAPKQEQKASLAVPLSILAAGILIAAAILVNGGGSIPTKQPGTPSAMLKKGTIAEEVGLNKKKFAECLSSGRHAANVEAQYQGGVKAGVQGTPFSIIITKSGEMFPINGAQPYDAVKQIIETALKGEKGVKDLKLDPVTDKDHIAGNAQADIIIVEYSDTECPFCKKFHETMIQVMDEYGKSGKVAWVYRHFPLDALHKKARKEAEATECAAELGGNDKFWEYLNLMMKITPANDQLDLNLL